ncbi:glycosyltransferase family protein [Konateibacter massiliensis]|uniref:glycosyltransferase family 39 protein n=1 Tax=Konateibacter massiliensis TaxID=2002841 RepID=UPI000C156110|nr:glycosyltransferase family 39 protein [Konateibacter massiliensis]
MKKDIWIRLEKVICIILFIVLLVWFFPFITKGIDVQDTASYLTKYRYIFDKSVKVNELFYLFGEVVGGIIYHLMPSHQVLALNVASWICYTATAILIYLFLKDYMPRIPLLGAVLAGSFFGLTWVHCLNWNAISMLLQTIGIILLIKALKQDSNKLLVVSGIIFAVNTFVRLPNILQLGLVVVVFWHYFVPEFQFKRAIFKSLWFVLSGAIGGILSLLAAIGILGFDKFTDDILMLTAVGGGGESSHGLVRIVSLFYRGMLQGAGNWLLFGAILIGVAIVIVVVGKMFFGTQQSGLGLRVMGIVGAVIISIMGLLAGLRADYLDVHVFVAFGAIALGAAATLYYAKKDILFSDICLSAVIAEGVLTIGTDTGAAYYRVYMGLPIAIILCVLIRFAKELSVKETKYKTLTQLRKLQWRNKWVLPTAMVLSIITVGFSVMYPIGAGYHYATTFTYHESDNKYLVQGIKAEQFAGLKTSVERAELIDRLVTLLEPYKDYKLLQLGSFNIGYVITDMKPFFDSSWADLEYLTMENFDSRLSEAVADKNLPVIVLADMEGDKSGFWNKDKYSTAVELGESENYTKLYEDRWYVIYVPKEFK